MTTTHELMNAQNLETTPLTKQLREAAMVEHDVNLNYSLRSAADRLDNAIEDMAQYRNAAALIDLNGSWAFAVRILNLHKNPPTPAPPTQSVVDQRKTAERKAA